MIVAQRGGLAEAERLISRSVELNPTAQILTNFGAILATAGRPADAERALLRALSIDPANSNARHVFAEFNFRQAEAHRVAGEADQALERYRSAIELDPNHFEAFNNLGNLLQERGRLTESLEAHRRAASLRPSMPEVQFNLGNTFLNAGQYEEATRAYEAAITLRPDYVHAINNLGNALRARGLTAEARQAYQKAGELMPDFGDAAVNIGIALSQEGNLAGAIEHFRRAIALKPNLAEAHVNLGNALKNAGQIDEAIAAYRHAVSLQPISLNWSNLLYALHFQPALGPREIAAEHSAWNRACVLPLLKAAPKPTRDWNPERPLRVGYISGDFRDHPVGRFMLPLLSHHDRGQFQIYCYSDVRRETDLTRTIKQHASVWRNIAGLPDEKLTELIEADQIDILVELAMHLEDNRMLALARKPAPVQVTYLAYCSTTGSQAIDYRFTDPYLDPTDADQQFYSEFSVRLRTYWCYAEIHGAAPIGPLPALSNGFITFGCLNNFGKVSSQTRQAWSEILHRLPNSRLILHAHSGSHRESILKEFAERGIDPNRIEFVGYQPLHDYLATYNRIDIALDPFPYPGGTTSCDAIWMGAPVVTFAGRTAVSRGGASVLSNVGHRELIASSIEQYIAIASSLASNLPQLQQLRAGLRRQMRGSPLMDHSGFARDVESIYREMWRSRCAGSLYELGNECQEKSDLPVAIGAYRAAIAIRPKSPEPHNNLGVALRATGDSPAAAKEFAAAAEINPNYADAQNNLAIALREEGKLDESIAASRQALRVKPEFVAAHISLGNALMVAGDLDGAIDCFRRAVQIDPRSEAFHNLLYAINFHTDYDNHRIATELAQWENIVARPLILAGKTHPNDRSPDRRLRVGFVSPDFRDHTIGRFILPLFAHHDSSQMEIVAYAEVGREDWMTQSLRRFATLWRDTRRIDDGRLALQIEADQIDILIDLAMHSDGSRLLTFAQRPAPMQATYLAYCGSTGLHAIDYRISDRFIDPPGDDESLYAEKTVRLETFWCYVPPPGVAMPTRREPGQPITFGCLNNFAKINPTVLTCWAEVLRRVDDSTLLIHSMEGSHRQRMQNLFASHGVDPKRISCIGQQKQNDYFASYSKIDITLDPFPFGGGTTTCDALWMGVPVVTLAGRTACSRGGASILNQIGMPELVALRAGRYVDIAVELANNEARRGELRSNLRDLMSRSRLMDAPRFSRTFESLLRSLWRRYRQQA